MHRPPRGRPQSSSSTAPPIAGAPVFSMLIARPFDRPLVIGPTNLHYLSVPSWVRMLGLPHDERVALLRDPAARDELRNAVEHYNRDPSKGTTVPPPLWRDVYVDRAARPEHRDLEGRSVAEIAAGQGEAPADALLDLALDEDLATEFRWRTESPEWTEAVRTAQLDSRMIVGISDGGAHLARDDGADWSSYFLRRWVLDRHVWTLEEGIRQITQIPASLVGLADRGVIAPGRWADLMVFDPETIGPWKKEFVHDLPGNVGRFKALGPRRQSDDRQRRADRARRPVDRAPPRPGGPARVTAVGSPARRRTAGSETVAQARPT